MQSDKTVLEVFTWLQRNETKCLGDGLNAWFNLCSCGSNENKKNCAILKCVELSPKCIELFQVWASLDKKLGVSLLEVEYIPCLLTNERHEGIQHTSLSKCDVLERETLCHSLVTCFAVVLEHDELDVSSYLTHQSRVVIGSCLLKYCLRPLYRIMKLIDFGSGNFTGVCRLLKSFTMINKNVTEIFFNSFNFNHPLFLKLLVYPNMSFKQLYGSLRQHTLLFQSGLLGFVHPNKTREKCREELVQLFLNLLHSSYLMELLQKKKFFLYIIKYLCFDSINECYRILKHLKKQICYSTVLSHPTKMDVFSYDVLDSLCFTWTLYGIVREMHNQSSYNTCLMPKKGNETLLNTLTLFKELVRWRMRHGFFETEKELKIVKECSTWLHNVFFMEQQELFCQVVCESPVLCIDVLEKLEMNILTQQLAFSLPSQPSLCGVWIHYTILLVRLLHPSMDSLFDSCDALLQDEHIDLSQYALDKLGKKKSPKEKLIFDIQKHLLPLNNNNGNTKNQCSLNALQEPCFWLPALHESQEECQTLSQCISFICGGFSHFFNPSNLTSIILNSSPSMVFIGLSVLQSVICRAIRLKKRYESASKLHAFLNHFMMMRLVDLQTLIHLFSKFVSATPSLPYDWCLATSVGEEKVRYDHEEEKEKQETETDDLQLPTVQSTLSVPVSNNVASQRLCLRSCQFSLKELLQEFHRFLPILDNENEETDLFTRWCSTLEVFFRCLSCDKGLTHFNWCQLLNVPFNSIENFLSKKQEWKCIERQIAVLKLLDSVWNLNTFHYDKKKHHALQEQTGVYLAATLKWFQSVFRLWQYLSQRDDTTHVSWILSLEKCIQNFLYQTGIFTSKMRGEEIPLWMKFLKKTTNEGPNKQVFRDFFIKQIENVLTYFTDFFCFLRPKLALEKKKKTFRISFFTLCCCSLWYENLACFIPMKCVTELCSIFKKREICEMSTAAILCNTFCDFLLTLARKGNLKTQRRLLCIISDMRFVNFLKEEMTPEHVEKRIQELQKQINCINSCVCKSSNQEEIVTLPLKKCEFVPKEEEEEKKKGGWMEHFVNLIERMNTSYLLQEEWDTVLEHCMKWMREEKTIEEITWFLLNVERCFQAVSALTKSFSLCHTFQKNQFFLKLELFLFQVLNNRLMKNLLHISLKCIISYVFIVTVVLRKETKNSTEKKSWNRRPRHDSIKDFLKKIRFTLCVTECCEQYFQSTKMVSKDWDLQLSLLKFLVLYSFAFKQEWSSHWPQEWIHSLTVCSYEGSLSEKDQIIAFLKHQAQIFNITSYTVWFEKYHGFHERIRKENNKESFDIQHELFTWFQPNATRLGITLNNFPYHQKYGVTPTSFEDIFTSLFHSSQEFQSISLQENIIDGSHMFLKKESIYDPSYLFPFLLEKFRISWYALHQTKQLKTGLVSPLTHSQNTTLEDNKILFIEWFAHFVDKEGIWLRRIASEGILQLLILGLACTDSQIRHAASQTLALYRHFLLESLQETVRRDQVHHQKALWKKAVALCKENHFTELQKSTTATNSKKKETIYNMYCQLKQEDAQPQRLYYSFKEIPEILTLLNLLKNTITMKEDGSLTSLGTTLAAFSASCIPILLDCSHSLYLFVNKFLISRAYFNSSSLPLFLTNYWSVRPKSCQAEAYFVFLVIARSFGSKIATQNNALYCEMVQESWTLFNQQGVLPLLLTKVPYFNSDLMIQNITYRNFTLHAWNIMIKILFSFSNDFKRVQWLLSQYGVLQWIENHLHPLVLCFTHDEKLCFIRHSSYQEIQILSQLVTHYFMTTTSLLEKFKSVLSSPPKQVTICEEEKIYSSTEFHKKTIDSLLQLIQSLELQTKTRLGSSVQLVCC